MNKVELIDGYWVDIRENKWDANKYYKEEAEQKSKSLKSCYYCIDCECCSRCYYCIDCFMVSLGHNCEKCFHCNFCEDCARCEFCNRCDRCNKCLYCNDCISCRLCKNLTQSTMFVWGVEAK